MAFLLVGFVVSVPTTKAADLYGGLNYGGTDCRYVESARLLLSTGDIRLLRDGLYHRYHHAIHVFHSAVYSAGVPLGERDEDRLCKSYWLFEVRPFHTRDQR